MTKRPPEPTPGTELSAETEPTAPAGPPASGAVVPAGVSPELLRVAASLPSPALIYDAETVTATVERLRDDLSVVPNAHLCFAVKANRCPPLLRHLGGLGVGADVAGLAELDVARVAGMRPIYATAPSLNASQLHALVAGGALLDVDSVSQLRHLVATGASRMFRAAIGLRIRTPVSPSDRGTVGGGKRQWSRFGVDPADPELHQVLEAGRIRVVRLHAHTGELATPARVGSLVRLLLSCLRFFPDVDTINIGGGLTLLYADRARARRAWAVAGQTITEYRRRHGWSPAVVVEPGMLLTALAGYLLVSVQAADRHPAGHRVATVDASGWSLLDWAAPRIVAALPGATESAPAPAEPHDIAGASCYENDYLLRDVPLAPVRVGDRLVLSSAGAYVSSMARSMHGFRVPHEWLLRGEEVVRGDGSFRLPGGV